MTQAQATGSADPDARSPRSTGIGRSALAFAFVGSACLLVLEIVAGRLVAPRLGVSLYTWTSVIGVVLGGVTLGNYLGGRLADRRPSRSTLGLLYLAGSASAVLVLGVLHFLDALDLPKSAPAMLQVLWVTTLLFLLPSTILAAPTPLLTRLSLHSVDETGRVVGRIQAAAALGSILGTFLTGFFLITWFGTRSIVVGIAVTLLLLAVLARPPWLAARLYVVGALAAVIVVAGWVSGSGCTRESNYYCIRVDPGTVVENVGGQRVEKTPAVQALYLDALLHSEVDTLHPLRLLYDYEQDYAAVLKRIHEPGDPLDSFFIGGGGYVFPRYVEAKYGGKVTVAEIDPEVTAVARRYFRLRSSPLLETVTGDARLELQSRPDSEKFDAVFGDAFDDLSVPYHLTTREFHRVVARHLRPSGIYMLNVVDGGRLDFLRSELRTLRLTFPYVAFIPPKDSWPLRGGRSTFVIVAANNPPAQPFRALPAKELDAFLASGHSIVLTDDHAPVEQLLAPLFRERLHQN